MTSKPQPADNGQPETPCIPNVRGLSAFDAALTYAKNGLYVLPVKTGKHPGSVVGRGWPELSTRDVDLIDYYWDDENPPGIAIHTGKSSLIAFDLDVDVIPSELIWLKTGLFQSTRGSASDRGHYVFTTTETFVSGDMKLADGRECGEIRSGNTVIIAEPSPHAKIDIGAEYRWRTTGIVPPLPDEARVWLTTRAGGVDCDWQPASDGEVATFVADPAHNRCLRPKALAGLVNSVRDARAGTRNATRNALRIAAGEARAGFYPFATAVSEIENAAKASYEARGENFQNHIGTDEFGRLVANGVGRAMARDLADIAAEARGEYGTDRTKSDGEWLAAMQSLSLRNEAGEIIKVIPIRKADPSQRSAKSANAIFCEFGPPEWAMPVAPTEFLIKGVLCRDTWGVNSGPEKSLKTHDNQAIAIAVATGINLYRNKLFPVTNIGKVLYIVGEGGQKQVFRVLHRMCHAYGINPTDVQKDPTFPLVVAFGAAPLDDDRLRDEIKSLLDRHQPDLVLMESFYNFHPAEVNAANLYERGQVIDSYHKLVREGSSDVVSLLTDHNKKGANELGLRNISMAGQAENSDSWIQRKHRHDPDVAAGEFWLTTSFNGRDWGGSVFDIDWHLGAFDHDAGSHVGDIGWHVTSATRAQVRATADAKPVKEMEVVSAYWEEMKTDIEARTGRKTKENIRARFLAKNETPPAKNRLEDAIAILADAKTDGGPYAVTSAGPRNATIYTNAKQYFVPIITPRPQKD